MSRLVELTQQDIKQATIELTLIHIKSRLDLDRYITDHPERRLGVPYFMSRLEAVSRLTGDLTAELVLEALPEWI